MPFSSKIFALCLVFGSVAAVTACAKPSSGDDDATTSSGGAAALTADSIGVVCRTLGEIGQCGTTKLCKTTTEASCKAKASAIATNPQWATVCPSTGSEEACGWNSADCYWDTTSSCVPSTGAPPSVGAPNIAATCSALGELGACRSVPACKSATEGVCHATDDAIASDPQWQQMCPRAGTSQEACEAESNCQWDLVNTCTPRAVAAQPLDVASTCKTLGQAGACGVVPAICKTMAESQCIAKQSALASNPQWASVCLAIGDEMACGWNSATCNWQPMDQCVPLDGPHPNAVVDMAKACDTLGQIGSCSRSPTCKPVAQGHCRATANALAGDPDWANQCAKAGSNTDACGFLAPNCVWENATQCVPR
jgi:hypothetical protein